MPRLSPAIALLSALFFPSVALAQTRTSWQMHDGNELGPYASPNEDIVVWGYSMGAHGDPTEYDYAAEIPAEDDAGWGPAPDPEVIGFSITSRLCSLVTCLQGGDFTYFQTLVNVPTDVVVTDFTITFSGMDDGARITVINSAYPDGLVIPGSYVYLGGTSTSDLSSYIVSGEVNRVVVTQVDDCCSGNNLQYAWVVLNGDTVETSTDLDEDGYDDDVDNCPQDANADQADLDGDGLGDACDPDADDDGFESTADCDDLEALINPDALELCDGIDNDCDGDVDEDDAADALTWYTDADGDGFGDPGAAVVACEAPAGTVSDASDCDDTDAAVNPDAEEIWYDGMDQDCDGASDFDEDGDGFDSQDYDGTDCDDADAAVNPDAEEIWYDGMDQDCDGASDYDADGDGFDSASYGGDDCDDADAEVYPGAPDEPYDGIIYDCDNADDDDADGDGYRAVAQGGDDCDDANSDIYPGAEEIWYDGIDQDCDDNDDDQDGDGWSYDTDCDDTDPDAYPGAAGWTEDCEPIMEDTGIGDTGIGDTGMGDTGVGGKPGENPSDCNCATGGSGKGPAVLLLLLAGLVPWRRRRERNHS